MDCFFVIGVLFVICVFVVLVPAANSRLSKYIEQSKGLPGTTRRSPENPTDPPDPTGGARKNLLRGIN